MTSRPRYGPVESHWMTTLKFVTSEDDGNAFKCLVCQRGTNEIEPVKLFWCSGSASNLYSHFRLKHPEVYKIIVPIIEARRCNKRHCTGNQSTIHQSLIKNKQTKFDDAILQMFSAPDISKNLIENELFKNIVTSLSPFVKVPTRKTLNSRL